MTYNDGSNAAPVDYRLHSLTTNLPADGKKQDYVYTYDPSGNITDIEDLVQTARKRHFTYDGLNRLIQASWPNDSQAQSVTMEYYSNGNIKSKTGIGNEPSSSPLTGHDLVYDYDNRLKEISGLGIGFVYDFQGARVKKILGTPPATTTTVYIGNLYELTEGVSTKHIFAGGRRIASKITSITGTQVIYHHPDHLGGLHLATGSNGSLLQTATYYPFGENNEGSDSGIKYRFTGQEKDFESGLYYFGARFYDPVLGRFISPDTIVQAPGDPQTLNRYAYCRNNPLIYTDPTGHDFGFLTILAILALGAGAGATIAAIRGTDIGMGALTGAISAGAFLIAGAGVAQLTAAVEAGAISAQMANLAAVGIHTGTGALSGTLNSAITGGDIGMSALTSGLSAGIAKFAGGFLPKSIPAQFGGRLAIGAVTGGTTSALMGGDFGEGAFYGAWTAGFATIFNDLHIILYKAAWGLGHIGIGVGTDDTKGFYGLNGKWVDQGAVIDDPNYEVERSIRIPTSSPQDARMQAYINERIIDISYDFNFISQNCATFVRDVMAVGGISIPYSVFPRDLMDSVAEQKYR